MDMLQKDAFGPAFCKDIQQLTEQSRMNKDPFKQLPQQCLNLLFIHSMPFRGDYITYKEYFTIQKSNILFMEYCYAILQCAQIGHGSLHCPFRNFRDGLFCSGQGEALGHEDGADEAEVAVGVVPDGFVGVGA